MKRFFLLALAALWLPLPATAQVTPAMQQLTMQDALTLKAALQALDAGSLDQCAKAEPSKDKDAKPPAPATAPCPFDRAPALIIATARNLVALEPMDSEFQISRSSVRLSVLGDKTLVVAPSCPDPKCVSVATAATSERQNAKFETELMPLLKEKRSVALAKIKLADLNLEVNRIPSAVVAQLAPIIEDFNATPLK